MTIQLLYYLKLYSTDKTTIFNQIHFFVSGDSFKDIVDQVDRFVADYIQNLNITSQNERETFFTSILIFDNPFSIQLGHSTTTAYNLTKNKFLFIINTAV